MTRDLSFRAAVTFSQGQALCEGDRPGGCPRGAAGMPSAVSGAAGHRTAPPLSAHGCDGGGDLSASVSPSNLRVGGSSPSRRVMKQSEFTTFLPSLPAVAEPGAATGAGKGNRSAPTDAPPALTHAACAGRGERSPPSRTLGFSCSFRDRDILKRRLRCPPQWARRALWTTGRTARVHAHARCD